MNDRTVECEMAISETQKNLYGNLFLNMLWHCPEDPRFHYRVHLPDDYFEEARPSYKLMVIIHGTGCGLEEYFQAAAEFAYRNHVALLAPVFPGGLFVKKDLNSFKMLSSDGIRYDLLLLSMIEDMVRTYPGIDADGFFLFGHSAGGQFVNRFLLAHPERLRAVSISAPGYPTFIDERVPYPEGTGGFSHYFGKRLELERVKDVPVQMMVGEQDCKFLGETSYGANRVERLMSLKQNFENNGIQSILNVIPNIGHLDGDRERIAACTSFFEQFL